MQTPPEAESEDVNGPHLQQPDPFLRQAVDLPPPLYQRQVSKGRPQSAPANRLSTTGFLYRTTDNIIGRSLAGYMGTSFLPIWRESPLISLNIYVCNGSLRTCRLSLPSGASAICLRFQTVRGLLTHNERFKCDQAQRTATVIA
jgi:hypothetical protein